ncbi:MAG: DUF4186 domain-containing protein [Thermodesulfobacteriota bacterium]
MDDPEQILERLSKSKFRSGFRLKNQELEYLSKKSMDTVMVHASDFINSRLAPASPKNDGKQTPFGKHPVFTAQHATGTCCRGCLEKWHKIKKGNELNDSEKLYILSVIRKWLDNQTAK